MINPMLSPNLIGLDFSALRIDAQLLTGRPFLVSAWLHRAGFHQTIAGAESGRWMAGMCSHCHGAYGTVSYMLTESQVFVKDSGRRTVGA